MQQHGHTFILPNGSLPFHGNLHRPGDLHQNDLRDNDVISGCHHKHHPGNIYYERVILEHLPDYALAKGIRSMEKTVILEHLPDYPLPKGTKSNESMDVIVNRVINNITNTIVNRVIKKITNTKGSFLARRSNQKYFRTLTYSQIRGKIKDRFRYINARQSKEKNEIKAEVTHTIISKLVQSQPQPTQKKTGTNACTVQEKKVDTFPCTIASSEGKKRSTLSSEESGALTRADRSPKKGRKTSKKANCDTAGLSEESPRNLRRSRRINKTLETTNNITNSDSVDELHTNFFVGKKETHDILIVYPFKWDNKEIEATVSDLNELSYKGTYANQDTTEITSRVVRLHATMIRVEDYDKLEPGVWLNDALVDFWMQWISRDQPNDVLVLGTHFHSTLEAEGVVGVQSWFARRKINIFQKKLIFIPSCRDLHWSLCVIVNPGAVISVEEDDEPDSPISCILFFDALKQHSKLSSQIVLLRWLNYEWQRVNKTSITPFTRKSCVIYNPEVPMQRNGCDCGVFVCRYALGMFKLCLLEFTNHEAGIKKGAPFSKLITNGEEFNFDLDDIARIRIEFQTFIKNLHQLYDQFYTKELEREKLEKKARKESRRIAKHRKELSARKG